MLLFVYGTLREGEVGHSELGTARCIARGVRTEPCYELIDLGEYPALVEGGHQAVVGDLYEVGDALLPQLDAYEDAPGLYQRKTLRIGEHDAQCYLLPREHAPDAPRIASGDWRKR